MKEQLKKIIDYYGAYAQSVQAIEEMSELTKELCKALNYKSNKENLVEEIADVQIMLEQLKIINNIDEKTLEKEIQYKIARTLGRMNKWLRFYSNYLRQYYSS